MSDRRLTTLLLLASLLSAAPLAAQDTLRLEARLRRLEATKRALADSAARLEKERFDRVPRRYFTVDGVVLGYPVEVADAAERALEDVRGTWSARYGTALKLLKGDTLRFSLEPERHGIPELFEARWRFGGREGSMDLPQRDSQAGPWLTLAPVFALRDWERSLLDPAMQEWLISAPPFVDGGDDRIARSELLRSASTPARRCLEGSIADCQRALDLTPGGDPYTTWYDPADLVDLVRRDIRLRIPGRSACIATAEVEACRAVLERQGNVPATPTRGEVRGSLYMRAIAIGGSEALMRLRADPARSPAERLAAAARMPIDSLLSRWHTGLVVHRAGTAPGEDLFLLIVAVVWSAALIALFAWRYRWHHV